MTCAAFGHQWTKKTGWNVKVCMQCGTDELKEAVQSLRAFQVVCREQKPVGTWPGEYVCGAIDVILAAIPGEQPK